MRGKRPLLGRSRELAALEAHLDALVAGRGGLVLLAGEPGIGKTRLADETCDRARARGLAVARAAALAEAGAPALGPFRAIARALGPTLRRALDADGADDERREDDDAGAADDARWRRFELFADALCARAAEGPVVVALDDLHDADQASLELLLFLARNAPEARVLLVGTVRDPESRLTRSHDTLLARIAREANVVALGPLAEADVEALARASPLGDGADELGRRIFRITGGNPLFVGEVLALAERGGRWEAARVPGSIAQALGARLDALGLDARAAVDAAAVLGAAPQLPALAVVLDVANDAVLARIAEPVRAAVLVDDGSLRVRFSHPLLRELALERLSREPRARLHDRCARALEGLAASGVDVPAAEIARHRAAALPIGDARVALAALTLAADEADRHLALEEAVELRGRAVEVSAIVAIGALERCDLELAHARALSRAGARGLARDAAARAATLARAAEDAPRLAKAALARGADFALGVVDRGLVSDLEAARAALAEKDAGLLARVEARLAAALQPAPDPHVPLVLARSAIARARATGDDVVLVDVLLSAGSAFADYAPIAECIAAAREMVAIATRLGQAHVALRGHLRLTLDQLAAGDLVAADGSIEAYAALARTFGPPQYHWTAPFLYALRAAMHGRFDEAERRAAEGLAIADRSEDPNARVAYAMQRLVRARELARAGELRAALDDVTALPLPASEIWFPLIRASCLARLGETDEAAALLDALPRAHPIFRGEVMAAALAVDVLAWSPSPDVAFASELRDAIAPRESECLSWGVLMLAWGGPWAHYVGLAERARGDLDASIAALERARARAVDLGTEPAALWSTFELAVSLGRRAHAADLPRAEGLARDAATGASRLGMTTLAARASELAEGFAPPAQVTSPAPKHAGTAPLLHLALDGETWALTFGDRVVRLRDSRGLRMLAELVREPGRELHALDLAGAGARGADDAVDAGDAGEAFDASAIAAYRARVAELRDDLAAAERGNDLGRASAFREELDAIAHELSRGVGLGGRARRTGAAAERARVNVQRRIKDAIERIRVADAELGAHLAARVTTGTFCSYRNE